MATNLDLPPAEQLLASAIRYLIQGGEKDVALMLSFCDVEYTSDTRGGYVALNLTGPRAVYEALEVQGWDGSYQTPMRAAAHGAFAAVVPHGYTFGRFEVRVQLVDITPDWRAELQEIAHGRRVHNQGVDIPGREIVEWGNLRFRSQSEKRIAQALDAAGVLFLPNCLARLNNGHSRNTKEADVLVCSNGKWGILEVDGPFHPRAASDHERDRLFQEHGIKVTQRFTSDDCYQNAPAVVQRFLTLLDRNG